ncbi:MAG: hypothetical protein HPY59_07535 [Anaerolineae bacterium]|nr:hypothetical protein [Anaerolineae bacterium]
MIEKKQPANIKNPALTFFVNNLFDILASVQVIETDDNTTYNWKWVKNMRGYNMTFRKIVFFVCGCLVLLAFLLDLNVLAGLGVVLAIVYAALQGTRPGLKDERFVPELGLYDPSTGEYISGSRPAGSFPRYVPASGLNDRVSDD